jgi:hypothetical protein
MSVLVTEWSLFINYLFNNATCQYLMSTKYDGCPYEPVPSLTALENNLRAKACTCAEDGVEFKISVTSFCDTLFIVAAIVISQGALLGKVTPSQYVVIAFVEAVLQRLNSFVGLNIVNAVDNMGAALSMHVFGVFFGLGASALLSRPKAGMHPDNQNRYPPLNAHRPMRAGTTAACFRSLAASSCSSPTHPSTRGSAPSRWSQSSS